MLKICRKYFSNGAPPYNPSKTRLFNKRFIRRQVDRSESGESEDVHSKQMEKALVFDEDAEIDEKPINIEFMSKLTRI
jgi:hypothetical protein